MLAIHATQDLPLVTVNIKTPMCSAQGSQVSSRIGVFPILRAGLGLMEPFLDLLPQATVHHLGLYRESTTKLPVEYYTKLPRSCDLDIGYVVDPMVATAGTAIAAVAILKDWGLKQIVFVCILASQEGLEALKDAHPDITIVCGCVDTEPLSPEGYLIPGLGDAGDRLFNTASH